ncbi:hypothetical protein [Streptomyces sp. NPDC055036]
MSAYDNVFALLISTTTAGSWDEAQALMEKVRAEDGQYADWYRDLSEAIAQTVQDPDRWNDLDDSPSAQIRYVQWLVAELDRVRAERDALRDQRHGVFETNERPLEQIQQEQAARLRAENETRTATREIDELRARVEKMEPALAATGRSLSSFIFDSEDPGADALGAQWLYHQAMPQADDPFAQPRAFRTSVFEKAVKAVEELDTYSPGEHRERPQVYLNGVSDGLQAAAELLEKLADQSATGDAA